MRKRSSLPFARVLPWCAAALALSAANIAQANSPWRIDGVASGARVQAASPAASSAVRVAVALDVLEPNSPDLRLRLTDGAIVDAKWVSTDMRGPENFSWSGFVDGDPEQQVVLTRVGHFVSAYLSVRQGVYELRSDREGYLLMKLEADRFPECGGAVTVDDLQTPESDAAPGAVPAGAANLVDVLIVFSPGTTTQLGGQAPAQTFAQAAVDSANQAFVNSQMVTRFRLAGVRFTTRSDSGSSSTDLSWLRNDVEVAGWRNAVGADLVSMISEFSDSCGLGYLMSTPAGTGFAASAFQVSARSCAIGNLSYAHEHGHNMGFQHNPENGSGAPFAYAYGHYINGSYRTVMSYSNSCTSGCTRRPYFSNPNVNYLGVATGVADQRDNARAGNQTAAVVALFRNPVSPVFANGFE